MSGCFRVFGWAGRCFQLWRWLPRYVSGGMRSRRLAGRFACSERVPCDLQANASLRRLLPVEPASDDVRRSVVECRPAWIIYPIITSAAFCRSFGNEEVLAKLLTLGGELPSESCLRRVGLNTVAARFYRITQLGSEALVAKMPVDKASEGNDANE